jgi:hypothetical protein
LVCSSSRLASSSCPIIVLNSPFALRYSVMTTPLPCITCYNHMARDSLGLVMTRKAGPMWISRSSHLIESDGRAKL